MKYFYNGTLINNIKGSIYVDKNRKKWEVIGSGIRQKPDGGKHSVYLKVKPAKEGESKNT